MQAPTQAPLEQFGGGQAVSEVFNAAHAGVNAGLQLRNEMNQYADEVATQDKVNKFRTFDEDFKAKAMARRGEKSFGLPDEAKSQYAEQSAELMKDMNPRQTMMFQHQSNNIYLSSLAEINRHVTNETHTYDKEVTTSQIDLAIQRAVRDPSKTDASRAEINAALVLHADRNGLPKELVQKMQMDSTSKIFKDQITASLASNRLGDAKAMFREHKGEMNAEDLTHVNDHIERKTELEAQKALRLEMEKTTNPWKWLIHTGAVGKVDPLVLTGDPDKIQRSIESRLATQDAARKIGLDLPFTTPWEGKPFADAFTKMPPEQAVQVVSTWADVAQKYQAPLAMAMFPHSPGLSGAALMSGENPIGAAKAFYGHQLLDHKEGEKPAIDPPAPERLQAGADAYLGNSIPDAQTRKAVIETAKNIMVATMFKAGKTNFKDFYDPDLHDAIDEAIGKPTDINGRKTVTFRGKDGKNLEPGQLSDLISSVRNEDVQAVQGDVPKLRSGQELDMKNAGDKLQYVSVGRGKYNILTPEGFAYGKDGQPFVLDLKSIEQKVPPKKGWFDSFKNMIHAEKPAERKPADDKTAEIKAWEVPISAEHPEGETNDNWVAE